MTRSTVLSSLRFSTDADHDVLTVTVDGHSQTYSGTVGPVNLAVTAGSIITWTSNSSHASGGFMVCAQPISSTNTSARLSGGLQFYTSSTCDPGTEVNEVALSVGDATSDCAYAPFQDVGLYPIRTQCGIVMPVPPPPASCPGTTPCSGNGACNVTSHTCSCGPGWIGSDCATPSCPYNCSGYPGETSPTPRGTCVPPAPGTSGQPTCVCNAGYSGYGCAGTQQTIATSVNQTYALSSFWSVLQLPGAASVLRTLSGPGNFTLFAPTNAAMSNVPENIATWLTSTAGASALEMLLNYHIVESLGPASVMTQAQENTLLNGATLNLVDTPATIFQMVNSTPSGACQLTTFQSGTNTLQCFSDGEGQYGNNESCAIQVLQSVSLSTPDGFQTEQGYDILTVNGRAYSGTNGPNNAYAPAGSIITWRSDYSVTYQGFIVCARTTPTATEITTNTNSIITVEPCTSSYQPCGQNGALSNGCVVPALAFFICLFSYTFVVVRLERMSFSCVLFVAP